MAQSIRKRCVFGPAVAARTLSGSADLFDQATWDVADVFDLVLYVLEWKRSGRWTKVDPVDLHTISGSLDWHSTPLAMQVGVKLFQFMA